MLNHRYVWKCYDLILRQTLPANSISVRNKLLLYVCKKIIYIRWETWHIPYLIKRTGKTLKPTKAKNDIVLIHLLFISWYPCRPLTAPAVSCSPSLSTSCLPPSWTWPVPVKLDNKIKSFVLGEKRPECQSIDAIATAICMKDFNSFE